MTRFKSATSTDVAKRAGVSRAAVSVVLNGARSSVRVSSETRQRILKAASELEYAPHPDAQALRRQSSGIIGFVPRSFGIAPYGQTTIPQILSTHLMLAARRDGYNLVEATSEAHVPAEREKSIQALLNRRVESIVFDDPETEQEVSEVIDRGVPVVQLVRPRFAVETPTVTVDPSQGINEAVEHLVSRQHQRIAFLGIQDPHPADRNRLDCFLKALASHHIAPDKRDIRLGDEYSLQQGHSLTRTLLELPERPTALFIASDILALGALRALYEARIHVPDEVSVVSYDDTFAAYLYPPLTSVAQPLEEVAERAISMIVERIRGDEVNGPAEPVHLSLPARLRIRDSTQRIGGSASGEPA